MKKCDIQKVFCLVACLSLMLITLAQPGFAQTAALTIKIEKVVDDAFPLVKVFTSVSDAQGFPVKGLQQNNFNLSEGGKAVTGFTVSPMQNFEQPLAVVLVMDISGSMQGKPLEDSIKAAKDFNQSLATQDVLGLVTFAAEVKQLQALTTDRAAINTQLDTLKAEGATALNDALIEAVGMLKNRSERRVIILITDGKQEGPSKFTADEVVSEAVRWSTPIYTIGFGSVDKLQLERFTQLTGGASQVNPDSNTVAAAFQTVLSMLREQYLIEFNSALTADGLTHPLEVNVEYQNGFASAARNFTATPGEVEVEISEPSAGQLLGGNVRISASGSAPAPISQVDIYLDDQPLASLDNPPFEYLWNSTTVQPGAHTMKVTVTDAVGNKGEKTFDVEVRPPLIVDISLEDNEKVGGSVLFPLTVDGLADIAKVVYFIDDQQVAELTSPPFEYTWDSLEASPGEHAVRVMVQDVNGFSAEDQVPIMVEMQQRSNLLWIILIILVVGAGIIIPLSMRSRRRMVSANMPPLVEEDGVSTSLPLRRNEAPVLLELTGMNPGNAWPLTEGQVRLGRKRAENDIPLQGRAASRMHALIEYEAGEYRIRSLVGDNPVIVNGYPITNSTVLCQGDIIEAGESSFRFEVRS